MRKRLLRSRSGFEKPESREEAIMQNILGASNVLEPSESNIEEILKSILYNTPYTKEAEFEIEKILLAIKNNGTYDGECESRDMKILFAILKDLDYTEEAESRIEELFIEWLNQRSKVKVLEGIPPLTFVAKGEPLINYEISGNTVQNGAPTPDKPIMSQGTGERTGNLFDKSTALLDYYINDSNGSVSKSTTYNTSASMPIDVEGLDYIYPNTNGYTGTRQWAAFYDGSGNYISGFNGYNIAKAVPSNAKTVRFTVHSSYIDAFSVNAGSSALPFEPYGYKIPISSASTTTPVYLGEVETTRKIKKYEFTGLESFVAVGSGYVVNIQDAIGVEQRAVTDAICSHYQAQSYSKVYDGAGFGFAQRLGTSESTRGFSFSKGEIETAQDFKTYLAQQYAAGTPVIIWYVLETEETGIVNEPLCKIGNYADTLSKAQAGVQIPTNNGTTVIDVDTTVKPSNIYIEYK